MRYQKLLSEYKMHLNVWNPVRRIFYIKQGGITRTEKCFKLLRLKVLETGFNDAEEEICFFKHIKPEIFSNSSTMSNCSI